MTIFGDSDSGRSTLALTAPGPIAYLHGYEKIDGLIENARRSKDIRVHEFGGMFRGDVDIIQDTADEDFADLEQSMSDSLSWAKSSIVDTENKAWEVCQLARLGSLERANNSLSEKEKKKGALIYQGINNRWNTMLYEFRQQRKTNLILICKTEFDWIDNKKSKRSSIKCQKDTYFFSDVVIRTYCKNGEYSGVIEKPWWNGEYRNYELDEDELDFCTIMGMLTLTDSDEWR
jgi:hypothetical protein